MFDRAYRHYLYKLHGSLTRERWAIEVLKVVAALIERAATAPPKAGLFAFYRHGGGTLGIGEYLRVREAAAVFTYTDRGRDVLREIQGDLDDGGDGPGHPQR